jgi:hypothetical protein
MPTNHFPMVFNMPLKLKKTLREDGNSLGCENLSQMKTRINKSWKGSDNQHVWKLY